MVGACKVAVARIPRGNVALSPILQVEQLRPPQYVLAAGKCNTRVSSLADLVVRAFGSCQSH